jgi:hypothetical protein
LFGGVDDCFAWRIVEHRRQFLKEPQILLDIGSELTTASLIPIPQLRCIVEKDGVGSFRSIGFFQGSQGCPVRSGERMEFFLCIKRRLEVFREVKMKGGPVPTDTMVPAKTFGGDFVGLWQGYTILYPKIVKGFKPQNGMSHSNKQFRFGEMFVQFRDSSQVFRITGTLVASEIRTFRQVAIDNLDDISWLVSLKGGDFVGKSLDFRMSPEPKH